MSAMPGSARQEAERLVATVLAMASQGLPRSGGWATLGDAVTGLVGHAAATYADPGRTATGERVQPASAKPGGAAAGEPDGVAPGGWATGSAECCVCPVCRVIAGLRDPDPETAERLATGAGDFAAGVASLLRAFAPPAGDQPDRHRAGPHPEAWAAATTATPAAPATTGTPATTATPAATTGSGDTGAASVAPGPRTGDDPWASATAAGHDPTATVRRAERRPAAEPAPPHAPTGDARARDPWAAATAGSPAGGSPAGGSPAGGSPAGGSPAGGSPAGGSPAASSDRAAGTGDDAPPAAAV